MSRAACYDRDEALSAAMRLFWQKGYHATSLKDLEAALQMKPGSIYAAFQSKENLYLLALEHYHAAASARFAAQLAGFASPLDGLSDYLRQLAVPDCSAPQLACMLTKSLLDTSHTDEVITAATKQYLARMRQQIADGFAAAQAQGDLPAQLDPQRLARRYQAYLNAVRLEQQQGAEAAEVAELAEDLAGELESLRSSDTSANRLTDLEDIQDQTDKLVKTEG